VARDSKQRRAENNSTLKYLKLLIQQIDDDDEQFLPT
jgi:hypothetical protein